MLKNQRGSVLVLIIVVFAVLAILGVAILNISVSENRQTVFQENSVEGYYAARSGVEAMSSYIIGNSANISSVITKTAGAPATGTIDSRQFEVVVTGTPAPVTGKILAPIIESKAYETIAGVKTLVGTVKLQLLESNLFRGTVFADQYLSIGNNTGIMGDVGTNASNMVYSHDPVNGDISLGPGATAGDVATAETHVTSGHTAEKMTTPVIFPPIIESQFSTTWTGGTDFVNSGINYYNIADIGGNRDYAVSGTGEIHLLVTNSLVFNGTGRIFKPYPSDTVKIYVYYNGTNDVTLNGQVDNFCCLYAPKAAVNFNGGGSGSFTGAIVCKSFYGPSSNTNFYEDPDLNMDHLMVSGVAGYTRGVYAK